ncbi:MAG: hypothetical protein ABIO36_02370 [Pyrinomonadaceae bacterium]
MKFLATIVFFGLLVLTGFSQSTNPNSAATKAKSVATKPKPIAAKPKPAATPVKKSDEKTEWENAVAIAEGTARIAALRKFIETFPKSEKNAEAVGMIVIIETQLGNDKLAANEMRAAAELFMAAAKDAPKPIPDQLFTETLAKIPANLYFRGARAEALEIVKTLEERSDANVGQMLTIASFYMSIESGSDAKRMAENAIRLDANSSAAYQTLGLANRIDFQLDESAAAYAKALELDPDSLSAKRGLAEMKRSLGMADASVALYREILAKDPSDIPAQTGLVLSLLDSGKRLDGEAELTRSLEANPGNVILLAGAAYWYAAHGEGDKAVEFSQKAIAADPRFIWSHIALARGLLSRKDFVAAERTLLAARRYGNFPTLEYEIATTRLAAGYYREAAEELSKSFSIRDGAVRTNLGGRVPRELKDFTELVGFERRASIFAPTAADSPENAAKLTALLELKQELDSPDPKPEVISKLADEFIRGDDKMKVHRQVFAATQLLEKKVALIKVLEIAKSAMVNVEAGLDVKTASIAVMAGQLYENRSLAATRGEYLNVPNVSRLTLSAILRGQIEELSGWAMFQMNEPAEAAVRLRRAVSVLPVDSAWWRSSTWRLATALAQTGKDAEALDIFVKSYKSSGPNPIQYHVIETLYIKVNGNIDGLEAKIGPDPAPAEIVAQKVEPSPTPEMKVEAATEPKTDPKTEETKPADVPIPSPEHTPEAATEVQKISEDKPKATGSETKLANTTKDLFPPVIITVPTRDAGKTPTKEIGTKPETSPTPSEVRPAEEIKPESTPEKNLEESSKPRIEPDGRPRILVAVPETPKVEPCTLTVSEESVTLQTGGGDLAIIVGTEGDGELEGITAVSSSPTDVNVRREFIAGVKTRAIFVLRPISSKIGIYQVKFEMPCGKKDVVVKVR